MSAPRFPPEVVKKVVELVRSGKTTVEVSKMFKGRPSQTAVAKWVRVADAQNGAAVATKSTQEELERVVAEQAREIARLRDRNGVLASAVALLAEAK